MKTWVPAILLAAALTPGIGRADAPPAAAASAQTKSSQEALTPGDALDLLRHGNERFVAGLTVRRDLALQMRETSGGQYPFAAVLGCIDSRVPPELVFDTGLGDIFSARVAGNVIDDVLLGSLEFAVLISGAKAIVVLGHTECGAVKGACDGVKRDHLTDTLALLEPALEAAADVPKPHDSSNREYVAKVTEANARLTASAILERSPALAARAKEGGLRVQPAIYDVSTGRVRFLD